METMPMWCPPTPPQEQNDVYLDQSMCFLYESQAMLDTQLPPIYVKKELKRARAAEMSPGMEGRRAIKMHRKEDSPSAAPRSLFDHPSSALQKMRREMKLQKFRGLVRPSMQLQGHKPTIPNKPSSDQENGPEWTIHEDWALLQSIEKLQELPLNLVVLNPGHTPNWDMVADMVNVVSRIYRSPTQCRNRYESFIVPREEGKILQESKKQKKTKSVYKIPMTKSNRSVRTSQLYLEDNNASFTEVYHQRYDNIKTLSIKRKPTVKPLLVNPMLKNPKHAAVLAESGISYEAPLNPIEIATRRAERIAKEKQKSIQALQASSASTAQAMTPEQLAAQQLLQQRQQQLVAASTVNKTVSVATVAAPVTVSVGIPIVTTTPAQVVVTSTPTPPPTQSIVVAQQMNPVVASAGIATLTPNMRQARPVATIPVSIQEIVAASQSRVVTNATTAVVSVASLTPAQIQAARIATGSLVSAAAIPGTVGTVTTVKGTTIPAVTVASGKSLNPAQIQYYRQQAILRQQQQRLTMRDQQLKVISGQHAASTALGQVAVIGQQKVAAVATVSGVTAVQPVSPSQQKTQAAGLIAKGRQEEVAALMKQQMQRQQKAAVAVSQQPALTAQILAQAGLNVQTSTGAQQVATLVKTSASGQSVTIPMAGIAIPQVKATINSGLKAAPGSTQQIRQLGLNYQQLVTKQGRVTGAKVAQIAKPGLQTQLIVQSQSGKAVPAISMQHIQQVMKNVQPSHLTGQPLVQQGSQVVLAKSPQLNASGIQTRVIPVTGAQGAGRQTIQVVPGTAIRAVSNMTIDASGRSQVNVSSTLASALSGTMKATSTQQAFISQVAATLPGIVRQAGVNPVRIQTSTSGTPIMAVTVQQPQQARAQSSQQDQQGQS